MCVFSSMHPISVNYIFVVIKIKNSESSFIFFFTFPRTINKLPSLPIAQLPK